MPENQNFQTTLAESVEFKGHGLHSGVTATMRLFPADAGTGVVFRRVDLAGSPEVKANLDNVTATERGTVVTCGPASAATIEHLLGALYGMGVDNAVVELSGPEVPIADGSAREHVALIKRAGIRVLSAPREYFDVAEETDFSVGAKKLKAAPASDGQLELRYQIDYQNPHLGCQELRLVLNSENFEAQIAGARTFCFEHEIEAMRKAGLIKGGGLDCALVIGADGLMNPPLRFTDEFVRHKILDFIGDLSLLGKRVRGLFEIERGGHQFHVEAVRALRDKSSFKINTRSATMAETNSPLMDINEIQKLLPHRFPFLLLDRVTAFEPKKSAVGIKNVSMNEWFFQGHFPGHPIMPGVLIVEGMAQCGGILIMKSFPETAGKLTYFMSIDGVRFRRPVVPGDVLRYEVEILKIKGPVSRIKGRAFVGAELACEAELMCMVVDK